MKFNKRDLETMYAALWVAIQWETDLVEAYRTNPRDPACKKAKSAAKRYAKLRLKIGADFSAKQADKEADEP